MSDAVEIHVAFDDHDSPRGGCTTHLASLFIYILLKETSINPLFIDYPLLIRLNPGIPWKTRGNGAVVLRLSVPRGREEDLVELAVQTSIEYSLAFKSRTSSPGLAVLMGGKAERMHPLYLKALTDVVTPDIAIRYAEKHSILIPKEVRGRGVIGALAALGGLISGEDYTYELLAYRVPDMWGEPRRISGESVRRMALATEPLTFSNYDFIKKKPLIAPRGPDPVLLGIRGNYPWILRKSLEMLEIEEPIDAWIIYRSNQGTDAHCILRKLSELRPYQTACVRGVVSGKPRIIRGGHICFIIKDQGGEHQACIYEPAKPLTLIGEKLWLGDEIIVQGVVRPPSLHEPQTINVEKIEVLKLAPKIVYRNPTCPRCGHTMKSAGRDKGFKCPKCGYRIKNASKIAVRIPRRLKLGVFTAPPRAAGHLLKPPSRIGWEKKRPPPPPEKWFYYS